MSYGSCGLYLILALLVAASSISCDSTTRPRAAKQDDSSETSETTQPDLLKKQKEIKQEAKPQTNEKGADTLPTIQKPATPQKKTTKKRTVTKSATGNIATTTSPKPQISSPAKSTVPGSGALKPPPSTPSSSTEKIRNDVHKFAENFDAAGSREKKIKAVRDLYELFVREQPSYGQKLKKEHPDANSPSLADEVFEHLNFKLINQRRVLDEALCKEDDGADADCADLQLGPNSTNSIFAMALTPAVVVAIQNDLPHSKLQDVLQTFLPFAFRVYAEELLSQIEDFSDDSTAQDITSKIDKTYGQLEVWTSLRTHFAKTAHWPQLDLFSVKALAFLSEPWRLGLRNLDSCETPQAACEQLESKELSDRARKIFSQLCPDKVTA